MITITFSHWFYLPNWCFTRVIPRLILDIFDIKKSFLYSFSLYSRFATFASCFCFVFWLGFHRQFQLVQKTKNLYRQSSFWETCANALVTQTTSLAIQITSHYRYLFDFQWILFYVYGLPHRAMRDVINRAGYSFH